MYYIYICNTDDRCDAKFLIASAKTLDEALEIARKINRDVYIYEGRELIAFKRDGRIEFLF